MSEDLSYDVRIWKTETYRGAKVTTYSVRWKVGPKRWKRAFRIAAQADSFRAELLAAARRGEAFVIATGLPASWRRDDPGMTWYEFTCAYVDMKWKPVSAKYRRAIAQALAAALPAMIEPTAGKPSNADIRRAVLDWGYNTRLRASAPDDVAAVLTWLSRNTRPVSVLRRSADARALLETAVTRLDGTRAAATSARRNRAVLFNALQYATELGLMDANPIKDLRWTAPRASQAIDRRRVINPDQARALLAAVEAQEPSGPRLVAFFGVMYYCGLRPEEAVMLRTADLRLPADNDEWGVIHLTAAAPDAGTRWTDSGAGRDRRGLKHRGEGEIRAVPIPPPQVRLLRSHLDAYCASPDGHVFRGVKVVCSRRSPIDGCGSGPVRPRWTHTSTPPCWGAAPTTCVTHACLRGSMGEWRPLRLPSGQGTALKSCYAPTPAVSTASTTSPSGGSWRLSMTRRAMTMCPAAARPTGIGEPAVEPPVRARKVETAMEPVVGSCPQRASGRESRHVFSTDGRGRPVLASATGHHRTPPGPGRRCPVTEK